MNQHLMYRSGYPWLMLILALGGCATPPGGIAPVNQPKALDQYVDGYMAYRQGDTTHAKRSLESAVINNPDLRMARVVLGEIYRNQNDFESAAKQYEILVRNDPYTLSNHYYLGVSYQFLTRYRDAVVAYLGGLKLDPQDFRSNMNIGTVYLALGEVDNAIKYLDRATQIQPDSSVAWSNLGVALDARGSLVLAETSYRNAIERDPNSQAVMQNLANNLLQQKKTGEAIYLWEQIVAKNKTSFTQTKLAEAYTLGAEFAKASSLLDALLSSDSRYVPAINAKATLLIRQYELSGFAKDELRKDAVNLMNRSLALNGNQPRVADMLEKWKKSSAIAP